MKLFLNPSQYILTDQGIDLSIPVHPGDENVNAWYCDPVAIDPVVAGDFIGDVNQGGTVNFKNITINPHGNGTHTECVGHISKEKYTINQSLKEFHFLGRVVSIRPKEVYNEAYKETDLQIQLDQLQAATTDWDKETVLIVRTLENETEKKTRRYSGTNPPYFTKEAITFINSLGVDHLMVDLPSVDREVDHGALTAHKAFWNYPDGPQLNKTISELLFVPNEVEDGTYLIQIQIMSLESDASPSKIMAHRILNI